MSPTMSQLDERSKNQEDRIDDLDTEISTTRRAVFQVQQGLADLKLAVEKLSGPVQLFQKLFILCIAGIFGVLGTAVWQLITRR